jgi:histidinol-phosphatase
VTAADKDVERAVRERISKERPGDVVVGEEYGEGPGDGNRRWIIDPIDGTKSFVRGLAPWATLLALQDDEGIAVGVASAPGLGRRWWASRGGGAFAGGAGEKTRRIHVSRVGELADAQLCFGGIEEWLENGRLDPFLKLASACWRTRGFGDFWSYMLVAEGTMEIGLDPIVSLWDLAAPQVIVEEAGGRFTDMAGVSTPAGGDAVATNGLVHEAALAIIGR